MSTSAAVVIWLIAAVVFLGLVAVELAGIENVPGFRTVSATARINPVVRLLVGLLFVLGLCWWLWHSR